MRLYYLAAQNSLQLSNQLTRKGTLKVPFHLVSTVFYINPAQVTLEYTSTSNDGEHVNRGSHQVWQG